MQSFRNILVGIDLSKSPKTAPADLNPVTREAIRTAVWLAHSNGAKLTFFTSLELTGATWYLLEDADRVEVTRTAEDTARKLLGQLADQAKKEGVEADVRVGQGTGWVEIIRQVLRQRHDLVVVGTRDLKGVRRILFGSTAMKLLHECPCPVWVTKPKTDPHPRNVLVASDLRPVSEIALQTVVSLARLVGARVHLLHVVDYPMDRVWSTGLPDAKAAEYHRKVRAEAEKALQAQLDRTEYRSLPGGVEVHLLDGIGVPDLGILRYIDEHHIDLVALGTRSHAEAPGNTAERLLPDVHCSVLAVKPPDFESAVTP